ncbi:ribokinase [Prauserella alba]|uniref:Ribokinase n=1 Tax=Prauserella alba TaxID=176898 RepID=A0ABN1V6H6_9PSEU
MTAAVLVVGSANADLVVATDRRPAGGETVLGGDTQILPGGKGANTAVAAARLGADVALIGAVGDDAHGRLLLDSLRDSGVATDRVRVVDRPTGAAYITVTPDGENSILVSPGANHALTPSDAADPAGARVLVASLEVPLDVVEHAIACAAGAGVRTVLNLSPTAKLSRETLQNLDVLVVNEHEAAWLLEAGDHDGAHGGDYGSGDHGSDAGRLLDLGPRAVVITRGPEGALVATRDEQAGIDQVEVPSPQVTAVDTTGAGDAFTGALVTWLASGATVADAARRAVDVAAVSVTKRGAQPSYPLLDELS